MCVSAQHSPKPGDVLNESTPETCLPSYTSRVCIYWLRPVTKTTVDAGLFQAAGPGGLARSSSGVANLARVSPTSSSSLYRLGSLAALSPAFLGISAPAAPRRSALSSLLPLSCQATVMIMYCDLSTWPVLSTFEHVCLVQYG